MAKTALMAFVLVFVAVPVLKILVAAAVGIAGSCLGKEGDDEDDFPDFG